MDRSVEVTGQSVDEAVEKGADELGVSREEVSVEIIEEKRQGFLGLGKEYLVRVSAENGESDQTTAELRQYITELVQKMGFDAQISIGYQDETYFVDISGDDLGLLIGKHGETIKALQTVTSAYLSHTLQKKVYLSIDVEGYKQKRNDKLVSIAEETAVKVAETGRSVALKPMPPSERRVIHVALKDSRQVVTASEGDEPYRQVLVIPRHVS